MLLSALLCALFLLYAHLFCFTMVLFCFPFVLVRGYAPVLIHINNNNIRTVVADIGAFAFLEIW